MTILLAKGRIFIMRTIGYTNLWTLKKDIFSPADATVQTRHSRPSSSPSAASEFCHAVSFAFRANLPHAAQQLVRQPNQQPTPPGVSTLTSGPPANTRPAVTPPPPPAATPPPPPAVTTPQGGATVNLPSSLRELSGVARQLLIRGTPSPTAERVNRGRNFLRGLFCPPTVFANTPQQPGNPEPTDQTVESGASSPSSGSSTDALSDNVSSPMQVDSSVTEIPEK